MFVSFQKDMFLLLVVCAEESWGDPIVFEQVFVSHEGGDYEAESVGNGSIIFITFPCLVYLHNCWHLSALPK